MIKNLNLAYKSLRLVQRSGKIQIISYDSKAIAFFELKSRPKLSSEQFSGNRHYGYLPSGTHWNSAF